MDLDQVIPRGIEPEIRDALEHMRIVMLQGPRQSGKSTLVQALVGESFPATYVTLDDPITLERALDQPVEFVRNLPEPVIIDEFTRAPELVLPLKIAVDTDNRPGRFLITGSSNFLRHPKVPDSLAGRLSISRLWPLSEHEIESAQSNFVDWLFSGNSAHIDSALSQRDLFERAIRGGFPAMLHAQSMSQRRQWSQTYFDLLLHRDIPEIVRIDSISSMTRLVRLLATRSASTLNVSSLSRALELPQTSLKRYISTLELTHLVSIIPSWNANLGKRLVKSPKIVFTDSGLMAQILNLESIESAFASNLIGPLLETFVIGEITRQCEWSRSNARVHYMRTARGEEVDMILEAPGGGVVGIEIKATKSIGKRDARSLSMLSDALGDRFIRGIILHAGSTTAPCGHRVTAMPIESMWKSP